MGRVCMKVCRTRIVCACRMFERQVSHLFILHALVLALCSPSTTPSLVAYYYFVLGHTKRNTQKRFSPGCPAALYVSNRIEFTSYVGTTRLRRRHGRLYGFVALGVIWVVLLSSPVCVSLGWICVTTSQVVSEKVQGGLMCQNYNTVLKCKTEISHTIINRVTNLS